MPEPTTLHGLTLPVRWEPVNILAAKYPRYARFDDSYHALTHIMVCEDLASGRLQRAAEQVLCNKKWVNDVDFLTPLGGGTTPDDPEWRPDCPKCLEIAERIAARAGQTAVSPSSPTRTR
jgi:hypothetical protein